MHIKIMMLLSDERSKKLCQCAETILNEVAGAFDHVFSIRYDKIGEFSQKAYGSALTEETVEACEKCQAILVGNSSAQGVSELLEALDIPFTARYCGVPQALCGRHERGFSFWMTVVHSLDESAVQCALKNAFDIARHHDLHITYVRPNGAVSAPWVKEIDLQKTRCGDCIANECTAADAITNLIETPSQMGMLISPPYAGKIYMAASVALNPVPVLMHDISLSEQIGLYGPSVSQETGEDVNPIPMVLSLADLLRHSAGLTHEADCVSAAVQNVLEAGWRTEDMLHDSDMTIDARDMVDLVCEQISLAGQLMHQTGGSIA